LQRAKKTGGKKERRRRRITTRVKTLEEGQYRIFDILKEIQEWWEAVSIVTVVGQNASVDESEEELEEMKHEDGGEIEREEISHRLRAERLDNDVLEHDDVDIAEALAAADECACVETAAFGICASWEESAPYMSKAEGGVKSGESEEEGSENIEVVVDAAVEHEAMLGMVRITTADMKANMKAELDSLLRRVQGVEVCIHTSMTRFDRRLQEIEVLNSVTWTSTLNSIFLKPIQSSDAGAAMVQPSVEIVDRKDGVNGENAEVRNATTAEHADGADRRALQQSGPSGMTDGASRSMGRGGGKKKGGWEKGGYIDGGGKMSSRVAKVEHDGGNDRRAHSGWAHSTEPSETTAGASRLMGRGGGKAKSWWENGRWWVEGVDYTDIDRAEQADGINRRERPTEDTDGASRSKGRGGEKIRGGKK
jgi:hypothetical protein